MDKRYVAGFFDGEGCINTGVSPYPDGWVHVRVSMSQKHPQVLEAIRDWLGVGNLSRHKNTGVYHLNICGRRNVRRFIRLVYPHSVVKRRQLKLAYALVNGPSLSKEARHPIREKLMALKKEAP